MINGQIDELIWKCNLLLDLIAQEREHLSKCLEGDLAWEYKRILHFEEDRINSIKKEICKWEQC